MREVLPSDRFDQTEFSNEVTNGTALSLSTIWHCPNCGEGVSFSKHHFEERAKLDFTNLPSVIAHEFDQWAENTTLSKLAYYDFSSLRNGAARNYEKQRTENKTVSTLEFLDWQCPNCQLSARAYVDKWAGGRHGDGGVNIVTLIEKSDKQ